MSSKPSVFLDLLESFLDVYLPCSVGVRPNTIKSYKDSFRLLLSYMYERRHVSADALQFSDLNYETILDFLSWLEADRGCSHDQKPTAFRFVIFLKIRTKQELRRCNYFSV